MGRPSTSIEKTCAYVKCRKIFLVKPSRQHRTRFCCEDCMRKYRRFSSPITLKSEILEMSAEMDQLYELVESMNKRLGEVEKRIGYNKELTHPEFKENRK